ncbi:MAG: methyltransferase domain-containing protein [Phycisphaerae bacterium]|nr:methyltransferase domain-containing protein [Phycisphaerae bacterium]
MLALSRKVIAYQREFGVVRTVKHAVHRLAEQWYERRLGIRSADYIQLPELGIHNAQCKPYAPAEHRTLRRIMNSLEIRPGEDVFIDFGSGMGRVVVVAATYPFKRVMGIEIAPQLDIVARENVRRARPHLRCHDIELIAADANSFALPHDVSVIFIYNSFVGQILSNVLDNIRRSIDEAPRRVTLVYANPRHFEAELQARPWLRKMRELRAPYTGQRVYVCENIG